MKIKTLLPLLAVSLMLSPAVFATEGNEGPITVPMTMKIEEYYNITNTGGASFNTDVTLGTDYSTLEMDTAMNPAFRIVTNDSDETGVELTVTCPTNEGGGASDANSNALYANSTASDMVIVFTNQSAPPTATQVAAITGSSNGTPSTYASNPNAIAFRMVNPTFRAATAEEGGGNVRTVVNNGVVKYGITNGKYTANYPISQTPVDNSFSLQDQEGTYKATMTIRRVAAP